MGRVSISVDPELLEEVRRLSGTKSKREALETAMLEYVRRKRLGELATLAGSGLVGMSLEELNEWRKAGSTASKR